MVTEVMTESAREIFEELCFASVDEAFDDDAEWEIEARVDFGGHCQGRMVLKLSNVDPAMLAETMLGDDEPITDKLALDAVGEIANVLCGHILPKVAGDTVEFDLARPVVRRVVDAASVNKDDAVHVVRVAVDDGTAELTLRIDCPSH